MSKYDLVVQKGRVVLPGGVVVGLNIGVDEGRIAVLSTNDISGKTEVNANGRWVIPGVVDSHTHTWRGSEFKTM